MTELTDKIIPKYLRDKFSGKDISQFNSLPLRDQAILICGTDEQATKVMSDIHTRERLQKIEILGEAAREYINDRREMEKQFGKKVS